MTMLCASPAGVMVAGRVSPRMREGFSTNKVRHGVKCTVSTSGNSSSAPLETPSSVERVALGKDGPMVSALGIGAWSWGDRSGYWGWGKEGGYGEEDVRDAYAATRQLGIDFIDTAEVYGFGMSEELLGKFVREEAAGKVDVPGESRGKVQVATKFAPLPWRFSASDVEGACRASLKRLEMDSIALYMIHWPGFLTNGWANDNYVDGLAKCKELGLCDSIGVSNFNAQRVRGAQARLSSRGLQLASNQVQYSLVYRNPERTGVVEACREAGTTIVAYSPLGQGLLTGKYGVDKAKPDGPRKSVFTDARLREVQPLVDLLQHIGDERGGKTPAQISLNWLLCKDVVPIPGVKNRRQIQQAAGALGWRLSDAEVAELDTISARVSTVGAPFEAW